MQSSLLDSWWMLYETFWALVIGFSISGIIQAFGSSLLIVEKLGKHILAYEDYLKRLGGSLGTTVNHFNTAYKELGKIDKDVAKITETEKKIDPIVIEKPLELA